MAYRLEARGLTLEVPGRRLLDGVDLVAESGECIAVVGPSGSGKTSLLNCLCGITVPEAGSVRIDGTDITRLNTSQRAAYRLHRIGLIFQFAELLPELTIVDNVALPLRLRGVPAEEAEQKATAQLACLGLNGHQRDHPETLSGGEAQRVAIARALVHDPALVLADEPTGALDEANARRVATLLRNTAKDTGATVVIATHDPLVASVADQVLRLREGHLAPVKGASMRVEPWT
jgi:ABC-type lipoprotein export system ATPase subunit